MFWDRKGMLLVDLLSCGDTINPETYCETLKNCAIKNKRCSMLSKGIVLLDDNAHPHKANQTQDLIASFGWE